MLILFELQFQAVQDLVERFRALLMGAASALNILAVAMAWSTIVTDVPAFVEGKDFEGYGGRSKCM